MSGELQVIEETYLTAEEQQQISLELDNLINAQKNNRQSINKLVFECVAAMTVADDTSKELADKKGISRFVGAITGSNKALQDKINTNRSVAQYASQVCLQKLAEQNLMSFDLITAVNNKLNASLIRTDEEFNKVYDTLTKFFKKNRSELVRIESRLEKVERNVNLLNWQNSIEYQEFNGVEYADLDAISKIVCLTRDFYDITQGNWSTSDLLLLKTAMSTIDIDPKAEVNYYEAIKMIADDEALKEKLLGDLKLYPVEDAEYLVAFSGLQKLVALNDEDSYIIDTVVEYAGDNNITIDRENIEDIVASKYLANLAQVNINVDIECFDLLLDLLYNLQNYENTHIAGNAENEIGIKFNNRFSFEGSLSDNLEKIQEYADKGNARAMYLLYVYYSLYNKHGEEAENWLNKAAENGEVLAKMDDKYKEHQDEQLLNKVKTLAEEKDYFACGVLGNYYLENGCFDEAIKWIEIAAENGNGLAQCFLGHCYDEGIGVEQNIEKAISWYKKAAIEGITAAQVFLGIVYGDGDGVEANEKEAFKWYKIASDNNDSSATYFLARYYYYGIGTDKDIDRAVELYIKAAEANDSYAQNALSYLYRNGIGVQKDLQQAVYWYEKAAEQGHAEAENELGECYLWGNGVKQGYAKAVELFEQAAEKNNTDALCNLGYCYQNGYGVKRNVNKAKEYYQKAIDNGSEKAVDLMGKLVESNLENNKEAERIVINPYESKSLLDEFLDIFK